MVDRADSMIESLSKGMRQRIGLAQALVHSPKVLILDEPTIGLDPGQVREVRELIRTLGEDRTVLLSTHILSEVNQLCSRILIINKGVIVAEDSPETLAKRLEGSMRFAVKVKGAEPKEVAKVLGALKSVGEAHATHDSVEITSKGDEDARAAVATAIAKKSWDLLELRPLGMSLEDIFLELTQEDAEEEV
jgi:ABC-2 type transport system ATP-binding protein